MCRLVHEYTKTAILRSLDKAQLKSADRHHLFISLHAENLFLPVCFLSPGFCLPPPVKVNNCDSGYSCSSPMWTPFMWGQGAVLKPGRWRQEEVGEGQLIRKILLLIRAITQCHNYQCHQLVCNYFFFFFFFASRDRLTPSARVCLCVCVWVCVWVGSPPPPHTLSHTLPITLPDWIYANWTKIKSHLRGDPSWDSFVHTPALARKSHSMISSGFNLQPSRWLVKKHVCSRSH